VLLEDVMPGNLHHAQEWLRQQLGPGASAGAESGGVTFVSTIEDAVREADLAIDCVPDELESKLEIFCLLDRMAPPRTVLATPSTHLSIADLASCTYRPERCVAIVAEASSLAEGARTDILLRTTGSTSADTVVLLTRFWTRLGFKPAFELDPAEAAIAER
jgi:3-hydroxybutyryl-CoA dehydrogenase